MPETTLLYYGALLHDVGKVLYRAGLGRASHSRLGADFVSGEVAALNGDFAGDDGRAIAEQIRYHHAGEAEEAAGISPGSLAHITRFANLVATRMDESDEGGKGWTAGSDPDVRLRSIFNRLNGHADGNVVGHADYAAIVDSLRDGLAEIGLSREGAGALLGLLEETVDDVPASVDAEGLADVSLFDHAKVVAGIAACVHGYLRERGAGDYHRALFEGEGDPDALEEPMFLLCSFDMSGIQDFIYNISGSGALKQLRARSMYLELLLEHVADELLGRLGLNRANLLYTGGGHAYLLLPNTAPAKSALDAFGSELTGWLVGHFKTDLYVASAWVACSANDLANRGDGRRYPDLYRRLSRRLSEAKATRYDAATIRALNFGGEGDLDHGRECSECHRSDLALDADGKCTLCAALGAISPSLRDMDVFAVDRAGDPSVPTSGRVALELPFGCELRMYSVEGYLSRDSLPYRAYAKNGRLAGDHHAIGIWMGDYAAPTGEDGIADYAARGSTLGHDGEGRALGIRRLGVLRADVDDLGATFVSGLPDERACISRSSALSRALSRFFKLKVNDVLAWGNYQAQVIYSGGDDLFVVGNWSDVIHAAMDIRRALDEHTGNGSLTISAGVGMYGAKYPIARMAEETGELEDRAKHHARGGGGRTKDAVALWSGETVFGWEEFMGTVAPRMREVGEMLDGNEKGSSFAYKLVDLLRDYGEAASAPRLAYLLARSFEGGGSSGREAAQRLYAWACDPRERRCLTTALEWYVYSVRNGVSNES